MQNFRASLLFAILSMSAGWAGAEETLIDCVFDNRLLKPTANQRITEKEAWAWYESQDFRRRKFVFNMASSEITEQPGRTEIWRDPTVQVSEQTLEFQWRFLSAPIEREAKIEIQIDRFTGKAIESYSMLKAPYQGPRLMYWGRTGTCTLVARKI